MKITFTFFLFLFLYTYSFAQNLTGTVSSSSGKKLEAAYILNRQNGNHAHSDENGYFNLSGTEKGDSVSVTLAGYVPQTFVCKEGNTAVILETSILQLENVTINSSFSHLNIISDIDLQTNPVNSSQELLRKVPGLFIGQHAGGGKAEQIFLRGFDIDHGTDINISVDGMPVNMVSHAHGQGYADLHFLIPENIEKIDFDKGPYYANKGNLATAGYVAFATKDRIDNSSVTLEAGSFDTFRSLAALNLLNTGKQAAWFASEYLMTNGPFDAPQNFNRINLMGKYSAWLNNKDKVSVLLSHFSSKWDASGQVPERAVLDGSIGRFGSIDDTEGGNTSRTSVNLQYLKYIDKNTFVKNTAYFSHYDFELYSNFTFFLEDPVNGDQIRQKENRNITGIETELNKEYQAGTTLFKLKAGTGFRNDAINDVELSHTVNRQTTLERLSLGDVNETDLFAYVSGDIILGKFIINPAVRVDYLKFDYIDKLAATFSDQSQDKSIVSPKLNFLYNHNKDLQFFVKLGKGFHSNDTRVVVAQMGNKILPAAYGADAGLTWKPFPRMIINTAFWYLYLQQEFVYVGDAAIVEPSGRTQRKGIDLGVRYQLTDWLFFNSDLTYTHARSMDDPDGENYIPLAPKFTLTGGLSVKYASGIAGSVSSRWLGDRAANEDRSIVAKGYFVTDLNVNKSWRNFTIGFIAGNIFNTKWNETQFATVSRLKNEPAAVEEIHFTPGAPFNVRGVISYTF